MKEKTIEEYVENIHQLEEKEGLASTTTLAVMMGVKPPSITEILKKLQKEGYVHYTPHAGATLTARGKELAEELKQKHGIIADFLRIIGTSSRTAEIDACQIEHHVSQETVHRLELLISSIQENQDILNWFEEFCRS